LSQRHMHAHMQQRQHTNYTQHNSSHRNDHSREQTNVAGRVECIIELEMLLCCSVRDE
jgi:hypothetical protein